MEKPNRSTFRERMDQMLSGIRNEIVSGKSPIGSYLPSELELGKKFKLSKNSVRKALDMLVLENLIEKVPSVGTRVCAPAVQGGVTIRFGVYISAMEQTNLNQLLSDFHIAHPHIRVQTIMLPFDQYYESVNEYLQNDMLDAWMINQVDFSAENQLMNWLEPIVPPTGLYPFLHQPFIYNNQQFAVPFVFSPVVLCYNRNHFAEKNLHEPNSSWKWSDLEKTASLLTDNNRFGFHFYLLSLNRWPIFLLQSGDQLRTGKDSKIKIGGTKLEEGLRLCRDLVHHRSFPPPFIAEHQDEVEQLFLKGKVSMIMTTYFSLNYLEDADFPFDISPLPYSEVPATLLASIGIAMNRRSERKEAVKILMEYLLGEQAQLSIRRNTHSIPSLIKAAEWVGRGNVRQIGRYHMYRETIPTFKYIQDINMNNSDLLLMHQKLKMYWSGMENATEVCQGLEQLLNANDIQI